MIVISTDHTAFSDMDVCLHLLDIRDVNGLSNMDVSLDLLDISDLIGLRNMDISLDLLDISDLNGLSDMDVCLHLLDTHVCPAPCKHHLPTRHSVVVQLKALKEFTPPQRTR